MRSRFSVAVVVSLVTLLIASTAIALPPILQISDNVDDATVTLRISSQAIRGDSKVWCQARVVVVGTKFALTSGDTVEIWVYEDDTVGDEQLLNTDFAVTAAEAAAQRVDRTFDCGFAFHDDPGSYGEYYIEGEVLKATCEDDFWCGQDRPETSVIDVLEVDDDSAENDDSSGAARPLGLGTTSNRIARDQDWYSFELTSPSQVEVSVLHRTVAGRLDAVLFDSGGSVVANGTDRTDETSIAMDTLVAGLYRTRVDHRSGTNYNHYDIRFTLTPLATDCSPGAVENDDCGNCGTRTRSCTDLGRWTVFGACTDEGVCEPDSETSESCGLCGIRRTTCNAACIWVIGDCEDEGVCEPGALDEQDCGVDLVETRYCTDSCLWSEYTECGGTQCDEGETQACYTGPVSARGVGACAEGSQRCIGGLWDDCTGDVHPIAEVCDDLVDNDCDGYSDDDDPSCDVVVGEIGDPCFEDSQCGDDFDCLGSPEYEFFTGGYCGLSDCASSAECGPFGVCGVAFGDTYCLEPCIESLDCRSEYVCDDVENGTACIPRCDTNAQCTDPSKPICDLRTDICIPISGPAEEEPEPVADAQPDAGTDVVDTGVADAADEDTGAQTGDTGDVGEPSQLAESACGCVAVRANSRGAVWLLLGLSGGLWWTRRRLSRTR